MKHFSFALVLVAACGGDIKQAKYPQKAARVICPQMELCTLGEYELQFRAQRGLCEQGVTKFFADQALFYTDAGCAYSESAAGTCLDQIHDMECDAFYNAFKADYDNVCGAVWTCPE